MRSQQAKTFSAKPADVQRRWLVVDANGQPVSENRLMELLGDGTGSEPVKVPLNKPFSQYFTATIRGGSPPSQTLEVLGQRVGAANTISYARIRLW